MKYSVKNAKNDFLTLIEKLNSHAWYYRVKFAGTPSRPGAENVGGFVELA
jgi:hypothetical protein